MMQAKAKKYYGQTCTGTLFGSENERNNAEPIHNKTLAEELQQLSLNERQKAVQVIREVENNYNVAYAADELNNLPAKERERVLFDLHGIIHADADADHHPMEDDNLEQVVDRALAEMDTFLAKENKTPVPYQFAMLQSPDYVQDRRFRLSFLRAERFDAKRAAAKVLKFFELKLDLFGRELLCKDIQLKDLTKDDLECLKHGNIQILPARDRAGRSVVFACPAFFQYKTHDNFLRALFYQLMVVLDDDETQTKGVVSVIYACLSDQQSLQEKARPDPQLLSKISKVNRAVPMKVMGRHFCTSDKLYAVFFRYYTSFMEKQMRMRSREHSGSDVECKYSLMTFGIPIDKIPVSPNGELKNQLHRKWVGLQKKVESEQWNGLFGKAILLPSHSDVLIGRGGPIQNHSGNQWLGLIVESLYPRYDEATKPDKANIASDIATKVKGIGARFLKQEGGIWVEANDEEAREKICIAFRSFRSYQKDGKNTKFDRGQDLKKRGLDKTGGV